MSQSYAYFRDRYMKGMLNRFCIFSFFMYYGGAVSYYVTFQALQNSIAEDGHTQSLWTVGLALQISLVLWCNVLIDTNVKDWNVAVGIITFLIFCQIPLTLLIANQFKGEDLYKSVTELLSNKIFYLVILLNVFLLMLPFMLYRRFVRLIYSENPY